MAPITDARETWYRAAIRLSDSPLRTVCVHAAGFGAPAFAEALRDGAGVFEVIGVFCDELIFGNGAACGLVGLLWV
ncbi:MAG: hypothetical protein ACREJY_02260 [Candidatus Rokuibacteriota bacterium]